jgi:effector-binding domain-containing protein
VIECSLLERPAQPTAVVRGSLPVADLPTFFARAFPAVWAALEAQGIGLAGEPFGYYPAVPGTTVEVEVGFPIAGPFAATGDVRQSELPAGRVVTATHVGPFNTLERTYAEMCEWAAEQGLKPSGPMWEAYLTDPEQEPDQSKWRTRVFMCVE